MILTLNLNMCIRLIKKMERARSSNQGIIIRLLYQTDMIEAAAVRFFFFFETVCPRNGTIMQQNILRTYVV